MDNITAIATFEQEIKGRWPDFDPSRVLYEDWLRLFKKLTPETVARAARQYVLNHDPYKRPQLNKFRDILDAIGGGHALQKRAVEVWPQYFIQCFEDGQYENYGIFVGIVPSSSNPDIAKRQAECSRKNHQALYGGEWRLIICNDEPELRELMNNRSEMMASIKRKCKIPSWARKSGDVVNWDEIPLGMKVERTVGMVE